MNNETEQDYTETDMASAVQVERCVSNLMLTAAVRKACELELFPRGEVDTNSYIKYWDGMKQCIQAALDADC